LTTITHISARRLEDVVGAAQLPDLAFQFGDALAFGGGDTWPLAVVDLGLRDPVSERFPVDAELVGDAGDRAGALAGLLAGLIDQAHGTVADLLGVFAGG
jgi:hypothetical protein